MKSNLNRALEFCSKNIRSKSEVIEKLKSWNLDKDEEKSIIEFLDLHNFFFNDDAYIDKFLDNLSSIKGYSKIQIKNKLIRKHLPIKLIDLKLNDYFKDNEISELEKFVNRNLRKLKSKPREVAIKYLITKGFRYDIVKSYLNKINL